MIVGIFGITVCSTVWVKKITPPPATYGFLTFFHKRLRILNQFLHTC